MERDIQYRKVIWSEGMRPAPEHFQQLDRYHEKLLHVRMGALAPLGFGIIELDARYENASFSIRTCQAIMPDGTVIDTSIDDLPSNRSKEKVPEGDRVEVFLAVGKPSRDSVPIAHRRDRKIDFEKKNLRILFKGEDSDGYELLKIAELVRSRETQDISLGKEYIPRLFFVSASRDLLDLVGGLLDVIVKKRKALLDVCGHSLQNSELYNMESVELPVAWTIKTLSRSIPILRHFHVHLASDIHPEIVFRELSGLAGELGGLAVNTDIETLNGYRHDDLYGSFTGIDKKIRSLLDLVQPVRRWEIVILQQEGVEIEGLSTFFSGDLTGKGIEGCQLYLGINANNIALTEKITQQEGMRNITTPGKIDEYIRQPDRPTETAENRVAKITAVQWLPAGIPMTPGYRYFLVRADSVDWTDILSENRLAVAIPTGEDRVELVAIKN